jgi:hypothetical protein
MELRKQKERAPESLTRTKYLNQDPSTEMTACENEMMEHATDIQTDESLFCKSKVSIPTV